MHLHAFTIERLALSLNQQLKGKSFFEIFSISSNEIYFLTENISFKITFFHGEALFQKVNEDKLPRRNKLKQFPSIVFQSIQKIASKPYDRVITFEFENGVKMIWNLFGRFSHLVQLNNDEVEHFPFKANVVLPKNYNLLHQKILNQEPISTNDLKFLGTEVLNFFQETSNSEVIDSDKIESIRKKILQTPIYICAVKNEVKLSYTHCEQSFFESLDILEALHFFSGKYQYLKTLHLLKTQKLRELEKDLKKTNGKIQSIEKSIDHIEGNHTYKDMADLIMANLHQIHSNQEKVELMSFDQSQMISIKLKKGLSPQENAAKFYQKSKNERKQLQYLYATLEELEKKREELTQKILQTENTEHLKELKTSAEKSETKQQTPLPYKTVFVDDYEVRIGKGAHQNDELLRNHAGKDDLWFHIKNFSGSHVILRNPSKKVVPITTIERVAEIAAFHSKGKNETLAAVIYTPRKFVRKVKNGNPGQVIVTKEEVILVEPKG